MDKNLPARPNLENLRRQAKTLLAQLKKQDAAAKLADAQLAVARNNKFASWPRLVRHVEQLRALEGEWRIASLEIDGNASPGAGAKILIDGDRFRTESEEATYEGIFTIDAEQEPAHIDIEFVSGPEAGETSRGIYRLDGERLMICLGLVGSSRPAAFATKPGSGHALERLERASKARPADVTGGTPPPPATVKTPDRGDPKAFEVAMTPMMRRLEGEWLAVEIVTDGKPLPEKWLAHGSRTSKGNEVKVVFGGQTMVRAKVRIDEKARPIAVDYLNLHGKHEGSVSYGILEWIGDEVRFLMAPAGDPRPAGFSESAGTLSRWRRK